jgi:hypothetical protein
MAIPKSSQFRLAHTPLAFIREPLADWTYTVLSVISGQDNMRVANMGLKHPGPRAERDRRFAGGGGGVYIREKQESLHSTHEKLTVAYSSRRVLTVLSFWQNHRRANIISPHDNFLLSHSIKSPHAISPENFFAAALRKHNVDAVKCDKYIHPNSPRKSTSPV